MKFKIKNRFDEFNPLQFYETIYVYENCIVYILMQT